MQHVKPQILKACVAKGGAMYYFVSLLLGILISVMIALNGGLAIQHGVYSSAVIMLFIGLVLILAVLAIRRERPLFKKQAWFLYLGGAVGVLTPIFVNTAFGRISLSAILALGLLGQSIAGLVIDQYGLLGMPKHPFTKGKLAGLTLIISGIISMITHFEAVAVFLAFAAGITIIVTRTFNAKLADLTSNYISTFYNYFVGLIVAVFAFMLLGSYEPALSGFEMPLRWYIYFGSVLGVLAVIVSNIVVVKVSAFYLTLLIFIGQVFSGIIIDIIITREFSRHNLIGGAFVVVGLCVNLLLDRKRYASS